MLLVEIIRLRLAHGVRHLRGKSGPVRKRDLVVQGMFPPCAEFFRMSF
jgi:hypothetical protein